jgi:hypothetical protein
MHNPPAVGDPKTIYYREILYIGLVAISGFAALGLEFCIENFIA